MVKSIAPEKSASASASEQERKEAHEKAANERGLVVWTIVLAIATIVLAGIAGGQLWMFKRQLTIMENGVGDAKTVAEAAKASADASLLSLRPWLSCDVELGEPLTFNAEGDAVFAFHFVVKNVGHSPAMAVQFLPHLSLVDFHNDSMAWLKKMSDWNRDMSVNATMLLVPSGFNMGTAQYGPIIFPGGSKTFSYRIPLKRSVLEKSCEAIKPNTNFSPEVYALVFYAYPSATVRATTAVGRMILKIGGAIEMDKRLELGEMRLEEFSSDFAT